MSGPIVRLLVCWPMVYTCALPAVTIDPQHVIEYEEAGLHSLLADRWLAYSYSTEIAQDQYGDELQRIRLFDLCQQPAQEVSVGTPLSGVPIRSSGRWLITYTKSLNTNPVDPGYRIWDLENWSGQPALYLSELASYSRPLVNAIGTNLAAVHNDANGQRRLRVWDLTDSTVKYDDFHDLGTIRETIGNYFTANEGIIALVDQGLAHWDPEALDRPPVIASTGHRVRRTVTYWRPATNSGEEASFVYWESSNENSFVMSLPRRPNDRNIWKILGRVVTFDGKYLLEQRGEEIWLTTIEGKSVSSRKVHTLTSGNGTNHFHTIMRLGRSNYILFSYLNWILAPGDKLIGIHTYLLALDDSSANQLALDEWEQPVIEQGGQSIGRMRTPESLPSYITTSTGRWLVSVTKGERESKVWDLLRTASAEEVGPLAGISTRISKHIVADDRWLILLSTDGRLFFADLNTDAVPYARQFYKFEPWVAIHFPESDLQKRILFQVRDPYEKAVYIWHVSQFEEK